MAYSIKGENNPAKRPEVRAKISEAKKGHSVSIETREKISKANIGKPCWCKGKKLSEETCKKIGAKSKGRILSEETKRKIGEANRGKGGGMLGKHHTEETKQKISDSQIGNKNHNFGKKMSKKSLIKLIQSKKEGTSGDKNPNWKGGLSFEPYCIKFNNEFKERVRAFFNNTCVECGTPQSGTKLHVHHVNFNKQSCCDSSIPLFVALCRSCHTRTNHNRPYWEQYFTQMITEKYEGKCYVTKR